MSNPSAALAEQIDALLPQTQCTRCGYPDCAAYARAIAEQGVEINRCPPGGAVGIARLAALLHRPALPLDPQCGTEGPREVAVIDPAQCIGCTLCIQACPVDAIAGVSRRMHTVIDDWCTGCALCLPPCPVDCIRMAPLPNPELARRTGWDAWSPALADQARARYARHRQRHPRALAVDAAEQNTASPPPPPPDHRKAALLQAARERARQRQAGLRDSNKPTDQTTT